MTANRMATATLGPTTARLVRAAALRHGDPFCDLHEGHAEIPIHPVPQSVNAASSNRYAKRDRKARLEAEIALQLIGAGVPEPIPGDYLEASAVLVFPTERRRDEGNYRAGLEKALGDALSPHRSKRAHMPHLWLTDDTPDHFTFGAIRFEVAHTAPRGGRARITLKWNPRRRVLVFAPTVATAERALADRGINPRQHDRVRIVQSREDVLGYMPGMGFESPQVVVEWAGGIWTDRLHDAYERALATGLVPHGERLRR